jgi:hypothetical protein
LENDHVVAYDGNHYRIGIVAPSLTEFFARIEIENKIWLLTEVNNLSNNPVQIWHKLKTQLDEQSLEYLDFYYHQNLKNSREKHKSV